MTTSESFGKLRQKSPGISNNFKTFRHCKLLMKIEIRFRRFKNEFQIRTSIPKDSVVDAGAGTCLPKQLIDPEFTMSERSVDANDDWQTKLPALAGRRLLIRNSFRACPKRKHRCARVRSGFCLSRRWACWQTELLKGCVLTFPRRSSGSNKLAACVRIFNSYPDVDRGDERSADGMITRELFIVARNEFARSAR